MLPVFGMLFAFVFLFGFPLNFVSISLVALICALNYFLMNKIIVSMTEKLERKDRFFRKASHDLRTPLSIAKTNSEVILMKGQNVPIHEALEAIRSNLEEVDRMTALLRGIMEEINQEKEKSENPPPFNFHNKLTRAWNNL